MTTDAAWLAAVVPLAPIATPTSAAANAGASLMPSPTTSTDPLVESLADCSISSLCVGEHSAKYSVTPSSLAVFSTVSVLSPETISTRFTPSAFR